MLSISLAFTQSQDQDLTYVYLNQQEFSQYILHQDCKNYERWDLNPHDPTSPESKPDMSTIPSRSQPYYSNYNTLFLVKNRVAVESNHSNTDLQSTA